MSLRCICIHIKEVLQHGRLAGAHSIVVGPQLVLLLGVLIEVESKEHDNEGNDHRDDESSITTLHTRCLLSILAIGGATGSGSRIGCLICVLAVGNRLSGSHSNRR